MKKTIFALLMTLYTSVAFTAPTAAVFTLTKRRRKSRARELAALRIFAPKPHRKAKTMRDGAWVTLMGNIYQQLSKENYDFHDKTGSLELNIASGWLAWG